MRSCSRKKLSVFCIPMLAMLCTTNTHTSAADLPDSKAQGNITALDEIEAVGRSTFRTGDVVAEEHTGSTSRISRETLERTANALGEVLAQETGIQNRQSGGFGSFSSISIRAASGAQTAVYLDGVLLNSSGNPVLDLSTLELLNLDSVDIYRGSTPLQLGHAGIGGAVNLTTLGSDSSNPSSSGTRIRLGIGSFDQKGVQLSHQERYGRWNIISALSRRSSDNDFDFINDNATPLNPNDDRRENRNNAQVVRKSVLLRTGYQSSPNWRSDLTVQAATRDSGVPNARNSANTVATFDTESTQLQFAQVIDGFFDWNTRHTLYIHQDQSRFQDSLSQIGLGVQDTTNDNQTAGAITYWEYLTDSGTLGVSLDWRQEKLDSFDELSTTRDFSATRHIVQGSLHYVWNDPSEKWTLSPALRWTSNSLNATASENRAEEFNDLNDSNTGAQLGIGYRINESMLLRFNAGNYYREPSFGELFSSFGLVNGNPLLEPEEGFNVDASISFTHKRISIEAAVFNSDRDELIITAFDARGVGRPDNNGSARVLGVELGTRIAFNSQFSFRTNLTWQDPRSTDRLTGFNNRFLPGEAQLAWFTRLQYDVSSANLWYELDVKRKLFYDRANILPAPDVAQHSIGADWKNNNWQLSLALRNLSDENVEDFNGFPKPGRNFQLSVTKRL